MVAKKIHCEVGAVPHGKTRGSMKECADANKIAYWGENKADKRMVEIVAKKRNSKINLSKYKREVKKSENKIMELRGKLSALRKTYRNTDSDNVKERKKIEKNISSTEKKAEEHYKNKVELDKKIKKLESTLNKKSSR